MAWKTLKSQTLLKNPFFTLKEEKCRKSNGKIVKKYYKVERPDVAIIAAFTTDKKIILIRQYRQPVGSYDFELPAGYLEPKRDKNILQTAKRELLEETGYRATKFKKLQITYASAGFMSNKVHFFIAFNAKKIQKPKLDHSEELEVKITSWPRALKLLKQQKIKDLGSVTSLLLSKNYLKKIA